MAFGNLDTDNVNYSGDNYPELGIKKGMRLSEVSEVILSKLGALSEMNDMVNAMKQDLSGMLSYNGNTYAIERGISLEGAKLYGSYIKYRIENTQQKNYFVYDLRDIVIPSEMTYFSSQVTISGKSKRGDSIIAQSNDKYGRVEIDIDRYPLMLDISFRVSTKDGEINLIGKKQFTESYSNMGIVHLDIEDYTGEPISREQFIEALAAKVTQLDNKLLLIKDIEKDLNDSERRQLEIETKMDLLETSHKPHIDGDGNIVHPGDRLGGIFGRLQELLKKNS